MFQKTLLATAAILLPFSAFAVVDPDVASKLIKVEVKQLAKNEVLISAIKAQNVQHAGLDEAAILELDKKWRAEKESGSFMMISEILESAASKELQKLQEMRDGKYAEIFVMDNKGLNVAQSEITSDYWQGDEAKFQKSFGAGKDGFFVDDMEKDESTGVYSVQISSVIHDPETGEPIGAVTFTVQ